MMYRCRIAAYILAASTLLGLLPGCSNNPYPKGQTSHSILYRATSDDPKSLDPAYCYLVSDAYIVDLIYASYFRYHYLKRNPFVLELNLGAEEPKREPYAYTVKENGRTVTRRGESWMFRIKKGLRFQDDPCFPGGKGRGITADDFIYSFRRMADPALGCPVLSFFEDKILGFHEYADYNRKRAERGLPADYKRPVEGLQLDKNDPYVFRLLLNQPYPQLRYLMAMHFTSPIAHEAPEKYGKDFARHPVGSGAYILDEYWPKLKIVLKKNPNRNYEVYPSDGMPGDREAGLLKDAGKRLPLNDKVVFNVIKEAIPTWNMFLQGYLDWGVTTEDFAMRSVSQVMTRQGALSADMRKKGVGMRRTSGITIRYFQFNMCDPVVGGYTPEKKKLRQAMSLAFNTQLLIDLSLQGNGQPEQSFLPPGIAGYDPEYRNPYCRYNLGKAKKLLAEVGYPNGISRRTGKRLTIFFDYVESGAGTQQTARLISKQFEGLGINVESRAWRYTVYKDKIDNRQYQFAMNGWIADYPDPENFALLLYGPNSGNKGSNESCYNNPAFNRLFERMRSMDDGPERDAIIHRMRDIAAEDCPWIHLWHENNIMIYNKWLSNVKPHQVANDFPKYLRVDGPLRARMQKEWNRPDYWPMVIAIVLIIAGILPAAKVVRKRRNRRVRVQHGGTT